MIERVFAGVAIAAMLALATLWGSNQSLKDKLSEASDRSARLTSELSTKQITIEAYQQAAVIAERERAEAVERAERAEALRAAIRGCDFDEIDTTGSVGAAIRLLGQYRDCVSDTLRQPSDPL